MTTTTEPTTALATREFTDRQIHNRIKAAAEPGFGLAKATPAQLNMIYILATHYDVDPAVDITLYREQPMFTIDGRVRLMKRHPQYRGYVTRPLSKDEKEAWGYKPEEIVVECSIRTKDWGEIAARGKVSPDEFGRQPVAKSHPQEMAEKRAIARASRMAFGQDVPDEDEVGYIIEQQNDPVRAALSSAEYDRVLGSDADGTAFADMPAAPAEPMVTGKNHALWKAWVSAIPQADAAGITYPDLTLPMTAEALKNATDSLLGQVADATGSAEPEFAL